jgi:hypothetical protein
VYPAPYPYSQVLATARYLVQARTKVALSRLGILSSFYNRILGYGGTMPALSLLLTLRNFNQLTDFYGTWYEHHATAGHFTFVLSIFLHT